MPPDYRYAEPTYSTLPPFTTMVVAIKERFKEWVRREIIDFDPYDDEGELIDFSEELRPDK
ncbi:hypothetical protein ACSYAD_20380 [Acaryochloris marina NIES-2412]|uniref:hypothetical protein n=1 Tax=Acaryochloris marina TaxID=155978 RepID=UPI00405A161D